VTYKAGLLPCCAARHAQNNRFPTTPVAIDIVQSVMPVLPIVGSRHDRPSYYRLNIFTWYSCYRHRSVTSPIRTRRWSTTSCSKQLHRR